MAKSGRPDFAWGEGVKGSASLKTQTRSIVGDALARSRLKSVTVRVKLQAPWIRPGFQIDPSSAFDVCRREDQTASRTWFSTLFSLK
jgi:hypothetical protein